LTKEVYENLDYQLLYFVLSDSVPNWGSRNCGPDRIGNGIKGLTPNSLPIARRYRNLATQTLDGS
jgi:hypothetical protein